MNNNARKYIIQIAPLIPLPVLRTQVFSYWHNEKLSPGTLVSVPFYFREIQGIVVSVRVSDQDQAALKLKNIKSVIEEKFLSESQIKLAQKIAEYYFVPLGSVLKLMVPKIVKLKAEKERATKCEYKEGKIDVAAQKIAKSDKKKFLLVGNLAQREKTNLYLVRECVKKNKQCLILVPEVFSSQGVFEKIQREFSEEVALIHGRITKQQYYQWWRKIKNSETRIIVASKLGIFLPFSNLGLVIVQEEQDVSFKQSEAMPRYNAVRGAEFLAETSGAKLVLESSAPSSETFFRAKVGQIEMVDLETDKNIYPKLEIILPEKDRGSRNSDFPISKTLYSRLADSINQKKQAVVFVNRRGFSTRTICENCKKVLKCPKCNRALAYSDEVGQYKCLHCAFKKDILSACPSCGGLQFSHRGVGTQTVETKIKKLFPSAQVARLDADVLRSQAKFKNILEKFSTGKIDVLIGTQAAIKGIYSKNISLVAAISANDFGDGVDFNSRHFALSRLFHMANLVNHRGEIAVQSFARGNPLFNFYQDHGLKKYFDQDLKIRKKFSYPPFRKFVKVAFVDKSEKKVTEETKKAFDLLLATSDNEVEIIGPYSPISTPKRGLYKQFILIKMDPEKKLFDLSFRSVIGSMRKGWSVDVDPVSLF